MKLRHAVQVAVCGAFAVPMFGQVTVTEPIPAVATIDVDAGKVAGQPIPRTIFGTFLEPIGNSTYNGLWAELLENPSFESGLWSPEKTADMMRERPELRRSSSVAIPLPWEPLDARQGNRYEVHYGDAANSWQSLRVFAVPGESTGVKQRVYLPIHRVHDFDGSFYARHLGGQTGVVVALRVRDQDEVLASQQVDVADQSWKKFIFTFHVPQGKLHRLDPVDFVVQGAGDGRV